MKIFVVAYALINLNLFASDRNPIFFTTSTNTTFGSIRYWASQIYLTYEHNNGKTYSILKLTDTSVNVSCTITSYNDSSSLAVENLNRTITAIHEQKRIIHCLNVTNPISASVTLNSADNTTTSKVTLETEVD